MPRTTTSPNIPGKSNDVVDRVLGLPPDAPLAVLRRRREDYVRYTEGSYDVLLQPADPGGLSAEERAHLAAQVATINEQPALAAHYRALLPPNPPSEPPRLAALMAHAAMVARAPRDATQTDLQRLQSIGLDSRDIVVLSQLIAFVSYQARVLAGLRLLLNEPVA